MPRYSQEVQKDKALCAQLTCSGSFDSRVYKYFICAWQHDTDRLERMARRRSFHARDKDSARQQQYSPEESSEEIAVRLLRRGEEDREVALDISKKEQRDSLRYCGKKL